MKKVLFTLLALGLIAAALLYSGVLPINRPSREIFPIRGVDLSHYQGEVDWQTLAMQGIDFAYIKATEGSSSVDERFLSNWQGAMNTKLYVGAYHFFSFESEGSRQAENFLSIATPHARMLPPVADVECYGAFDRMAKIPMAKAENELRSWLETVEEKLGLRPIIYTSIDFYRGWISKAFPEYPVWIRSVYHAPDADIPWTFWQYSNRTHLKGYAGEERYIDMNAFSGDQADWQRFVRGE